MLAPEFILGKAIGDFFAAKSLRKKKEKYATEDKVEWSLSHSFFADMGGFRVIARGEMPQQEEEEEQQENSAQQGVDQQDSQNLNVQVTKGHREFSTVSAGLLLASSHDTEKPDVAKAFPEPTVPTKK